MRALFCIPLILLILFPGLSRCYLVLNYQLNRAAIERDYCENKNKPALKCHGACHLKKQLTAQEKKEAPASLPAQLKAELQYAQQALPALPAPSENESPVYYPVSAGLLPAFTPPLFRPPGVTAAA